MPGEVGTGSDLLERIDEELRRRFSEDHEGIVAVWRIPRRDGINGETHYIVAYIQENYGWPVSTKFYRLAEELRGQRQLPFEFQPRNARDYATPRVTGGADRDRLREKQKDGKAVCLYERNGTH